MPTSGVVLWTVRPTPPPKTRRQPSRCLRSVSRACSKSVPITGGTVRPAPLVEVAEVWTADGVGRPVLGRGAVARVVDAPAVVATASGSPEGASSSPASNQPPVAPTAASSTAANPPPSTTLARPAPPPAAFCWPVFVSVITPTASSPATVPPAAQSARTVRAPAAAGLCDSPRRRRDVTLPGMARQGWGVSIATAIGVAACAGAAQLGFGYGLGVITWTPTDAGATDTAWADGLAWATWLAASSTVLGAVCAQRLHQRNAPAKTVISPHDGVARREGPQLDDRRAEHESPVDGPSPAVDTNQPGGGGHASTGGRAAVSPPRPPAASGGPGAWRRAGRVGHGAVDRGTRAGRDRSGHRRSATDGRRTGRRRRS